MNESFFADYKNFIVVPVDERQLEEEVFNPQNFAAHYILTLSIFDTRLSNLGEAEKFQINMEKSIHAVLNTFNQKQRGIYYLQVLELDHLKNYFILALSSKAKFNPGEENNRISDIIDRMLTNTFYVGQSWFNLIGDKGRVERKLFCYSFKEYVMKTKDNSNAEEKLRASVK